MWHIITFLYLRRAALQSQSQTINDTKQICFKDRNWKARAFWVLTIALSYLAQIYRYIRIYCIFQTIVHGFLNELLRMQLIKTSDERLVYEIFQNYTTSANNLQCQKHRKRDRQLIVMRQHKHILTADDHQYKYCMVKKYRLWKLFAVA